MWFNGTLLRLRSNEQLVALFRAVNDEAYRVIHDRYRQRLFSYMRQMLAGSRPDAEARDTTCREIRADLALAHGRGVRANGRARRHLRDCAGCREYRHGLRHVQRSFGALAPAGGTGAGLLAKLGLGGSGSAAAGSGAAGGTGLIGGSAMTVTAGQLC